MTLPRCSDVHVEPLPGSAKQGSVFVCFEHPAGWSRDVLDGGIVLTGGGAMLRGLDVRMSHELGVPVRLAEDPLTAVVMGAGTCVEDPAATRSLLSQVER